MNKVNFKKVVVAVFIMFLFTACSKKLMPPEISSSNDKIDSSDLTASNVTPPKDETLGDTGSTSSDTGDSDFFAEEPILESFNQGGSSGIGGGASDGSGLASDMTADNSFGSDPGPGGSGGSSMNEFGSEGRANIGNGSTGSFSATDNNTNEFAGSGGNGSGGKWGISPDGGNGSDVTDDQIARRKNFQATSNLKDIHFNFDQYGLDSDSKKVLQQNASYLKQNPGMKIEIQGHCDERGTNNYNIALGERRAQSTKRFLVSQGIDSSRIKIISYGEEKPFCFNSNEDCWFQNRRAHFKLGK